GGAGGDPATTTSSTGGAGATGGMIGACENEMIDGSESDVDCGGGICPRCPDGAHCNGDGDCTSHFCSGDICAPCAGSGDCSPSEYCDDGVCAPDQVLGEPCDGADACQS